MRLILWCAISTGLSACGAGADYETFRTFGRSTSGSEAANGIGLGGNLLRAKSVAGQLLVNFHATSSADDVASLYRQYGMSEIDNLNRGRADRQYGLSEIENLNRGSTVGSGNLRLMSVPADQTEELIAALRSNPHVRYAEPNYILTTSLTSNDPSYGQLWGMNNTGQSSGTVDADIDAPEAWSISTGSSKVIVGVIDTGVDYTHPDLVANMWTNPGEIAGDGKDNDGNGYIDDVRGINAILNNGNPMDDNGHGTHVAGTIGATGNNGVGVVGVSWSVSIIAVKFLDADGSGWTSDAVKAFNYFNDLKARGQNIVVTNNSWGGGESSRALKDAMSGSILHVASAGNDNSNNDVTPSYPDGDDLPNIISVAATDRKDLMASFSNYGATTVDLAAPGVSIYSTLPGNAYGTYSGTSMAAPHVAGAAALLAAYDSTLTAAQIKDRLFSNTDAIGSLGTNSAKPTVTNGRLNIARALGASSGTPPDTTAPTGAITSPVNGATVSGTSVSIIASASDNIGIQRVEFYLAGSLIGSVTASPYQIRWDSTKTTNGSHSFSVKAYDAAGNVGQSAAVSLNVSNSADVTPPTVAITSPANGATVARRSRVTIVANATDNVGVQRVEFYVNNTLTCTDLSASYTCSWTVPRATGRSYTLMAKAYDGAGNSVVSSSITVKVP